MSVHRLRAPSLIVLVGPSGSGKSAWAAANFRDGQILSSDRFRALAGAGPHDQQVSEEAFSLVDQLLEMRLARRLTTVIDTLGLERDTRRTWAARAAAAGFHTAVVGFDTPPAVCRARNADRPRSVPQKVLDSQLRRWKTTRDELADDGFDQIIIDPGSVRVVPEVFAGAGGAETRQREAPVQLRFDLQLSSFQFGGGPDRLGPDLVELAAAAEKVGFQRLWLMDHLRQIPQVGQEWSPMLEPYTALAYLAGLTNSIELGAMVTGVGLRNVGLLAKIIATLDVLSGGRAICGIGAGWFEKEQVAYGYEFPGPGRRLDLLEDALQALPLLWGPGNPAFTGKVISIPEALCYPRPVQDRIPILVGGGGERRTLRLVAHHADASNLIGDPLTIAHKLEVLDTHCRAIGRDRSEIEITALAPTLHSSTTADLSDRLERLATSSRSQEGQAAQLGAGTTVEQIGRFRDLAEAGVDTVVVTLTDLHGPSDIEGFAPIVEAFR